MDLHVTLDGRASLSVQVYRQILEAVLDKRLRAGERLPPTRELARRLDVARNTVALAYERLIGEGVLRGRVGAGTYVAGDPVRSAPEHRAPSGASVSPRRVWSTVPALWRTAARAEVRYDFRAGSPDPALFPFTAWRRLVARELRPARFRVSAYADPAGDPKLRAAIARHVGLSRGVRAGVDDVIVTQGAQQALDLLGRVLLEPGTSVAVEEPGYPPARHLFRSLGARVVAVPVDEQGLVVRAIPRSVRLVYVTPSHQFPLGMPMSLPRRTALLAWAERRGGIVVEDDYDSEFRFEGRPLDPIQSLDRGGRVVYVGSFSKVMLPALRLGFLIAPASLQDALRRARALSDWHGEPATQAALARFIDDGLLARHVRKAAREYAVRRQRILDALHRDFRAWLRPVTSAAGLHVAARQVLGIPIAPEEVVRRAEGLGVLVRPLSYFCAGEPGSDGLVLGYGAIPTSRIGEGLERLAACFAGHER